MELNRSIPETSVDITPPPAPSPSPDHEHEALLAAQLASKARARNIMGAWPIRKAVLTMTWPALLSMLCIAIYQVIDTIWAGYICGDLALAAMTLGLPLELVISGLFIAPAVGGSTVHGRVLGEANYLQAKQVMGNTLFFGFIVIVIVWALIPALRPLLRLIGASDAAGTLDPANDYLLVIAIGSPALVLAYTSNNFFRAEGAVMLSSIAMICQSVANAVLDPAWMKLFGAMLGHARAIMGAAFSTVFSQVIAASFGIVYFLILKRGAVSFGLKHIRPKFKLLSEMAGIGLATTMSQISNAVLLLTINLTIQYWTGTDADSPESTLKVAASGTFMRTMNFAYAIAISAAQGLAPLAAFCDGAGLRHRLRAASSVTASMLFPLMVLIIVVFEACAGVMGKIYSLEGEAVAQFATLMRFGAPTLIPYAFCIYLYPQFQAVRMPAVAGLLISLPTFLGPVPCIIAGSYFGKSVTWLAAGFLIGSYLALIVAVVVVFMYRKRIYICKGIPEDPVFVAEEGPAVVELAPASSALSSSESTDEGVTTPIIV